MGRVAVVTDSTADFVEEAGVKHGIGIVPLVVNWDGETYRDKVDLGIAEFYQRLRQSKTSPTTGAPSLGAFDEVYRRMLEQHDSLVSIHLSSKLSATYDVACQAAEMVAPDRIAVVDSESLTVCLGWLAEQAARLGESESSHLAIADEINRMKSRIHVYFALDTLEYLRRGGRIGRAQSLLGTLLNVKPILTFQEGIVHPRERVRTFGAAVKRIAELVNSHSDAARVGVLHGDNPTSAAELARMLGERFPDMRIETGEIGAVLGVHGGPGVVGAAVLLRS